MGLAGVIHTIHGLSYSFHFQVLIQASDTTAKQLIHLDIYEKLKMKIINNNSQFFYR
jgi:hypothetical protein